MSEELREVEETTEKEDDGTFSYEERRRAAAQSSHEDIVDGIKEVALAIVALAGFMLYFVSLLGFISFIMIDKWAPHYLQLLAYAGVLSIVSEILYIIFRVRKKKKQKALKRYLES